MANPGCFPNFACGYLSDKVVCETNLAPAERFCHGGKLTCDEHDLRGHRESAFPTVQVRYRDRNRQRSSHGSKGQFKIPATPPMLWLQASISRMVWRKPFLHPPAIQRRDKEKISQPTGHSPIYLLYRRRSHDFLLQPHAWRWLPCGPGDELLGLLAPERLHDMAHWSCHSFQPVALVLDADQGRHDLDPAGALLLRRIRRLVQQLLLLERGVLTTQESLYPTQPSRGNLEGE